MEMIPITPERKAQLEEFAWELRDFQEAVEGIRDGYADLKVGRAQPSEEVFEELRERHGLPR
jgi:hypothetical protein